MSAIKHARLEMPADLHARMAEHCTRKGTTQKDYINGLIERDLVEGPKREKLADEARNQREATKAEPLLKLLQKVAGDVSALVARLQHELPASLKSVGGQVVADVAKLVDLSVITSKLDAEAAAVIERQNALRGDVNKRLSETNDAVSTHHQEVIQRLQHVSEAIVLTSTRKHLLVAAAIAGTVGAQMTFAFSFPASTPIRWLVVRGMGEKTERAAATVLAGSGIPFDGELIAETAALVQNPAFANRYRDCIDRAKRSKLPTITCRLRMPALDVKS